MGEGGRRLGPEESRDEADTVNAIGEDGARIHHRTPIGEDFREASDLLDGIRDRAPERAAAIISARARHERARAEIGPEKLHALTALQGRLAAEFGNDLHDFRGQRFEQPQSNKEAYAESARNAIERSIHRVIDAAMDNPANVALFADQAEFRRDWWRSVRFQLEAEARQELLGNL